MPKTKAIIIPKWVHDMKKGQLNTMLYHYLPSLMHWRNLEFMEQQLLSFTPHASARSQIQEVITHIKELIGQQAKETHPLVSKISMSEHIPQQIIVEIAQDVDKPDFTGVLVLRVDIHGDITGVEREYQMNYRTN